MSDYDPTVPSTMEDLFGKSVAKKLAAYVGKIQLMRGEMHIQYKGREYEYHIADSTRARRKTLRVLVEQKLSGLSVFRRLIAMRTLLKNRGTQAQFDTLTSDAHYVKDVFYHTEYWR